MLPMRSDALDMAGASLPHRATACHKRAGRRERQSVPVNGRRNEPTQVFTGCRRATPTVASSDRSSAAWGINDTLTVSLARMIHSASKKTNERLHVHCYINYCRVALNIWQDRSDVHRQNQTVTNW